MRGVMTSLPTLPTYSSATQKTRAARGRARHHQAPLRACGVGVAGGPVADPDQASLLLCLQTPIWQQAAIRWKSSVRAAGVKDTRFSPADETF